MIHMVRALADDLGLTPRCAVLLALTFVAFALALNLEAGALYGVTLGLAFAAGCTWGRTISCDECGESLETESAS